MKILVTGAAGFIGYHLAKFISEEQGTEVLCVDDGSRGVYDEYYMELTRRPNVHGIDCDLTENAEVRRLPDNVDIVYHMAALNGTQNFYERPFDVVRCCTMPTLHLLEKYSNRREQTRFVYAGSSESYASTVTKFGWEVPTGEDVPLGIDDVRNARWSYGGSKMHGEIATANAGRQCGMEYTIIRYHNVYGPRMGDKHVVPDFFIRARRGVFELYGHEDTRSFMYIDDAVRATTALANASAARNEIVNVGGSREVSIRELGKMMMTAAELEGKIQLYPSPEGSVRRRCPKVNKLARMVGFEEAWRLEEGLKKAADFYLGGA